MKHYLPYYLFLVAGYHRGYAFTAPSFKLRRTVSASSSAVIPSSSSYVSTGRSVSTESDYGIDETFDEEPAVSPEYALFLPGQTLRIQIGDVSASRKAWKKRRRNSSPILIPCSILGVNREWMVRWNVMTLLHQIGEESPNAPGGAVGLTSGKLGRAYKQRLGGDLREHAKALGHDSIESLLQSLFDDRIQAEYGVQTFFEPQYGNLMLITSLTRNQARSFSSKAGMIGFLPHEDEEEKMIHTGIAKVKINNRNKIDNSSKKMRPRFSIEPLGAALRVSPYDEAAERYKQGDELNAFVYSYDVAGDNESPLLVLTADDPRGKGVALGTGTFGSSTRVFKRRNVKGGTLANDASIESELGNLRVGDGPISATVVAVSSHSNALFVDCGVGRKRGKKYGGGVVKVLGMLRFDDIKESNVSVDGDNDELDIQAGDDIQVYVKAVFPQSGRFMVTLDPSVQNQKAKEMKLEKEADKRKERLSNKFDEDFIRTLIGNEYEGIVKAKSKTGDWYYVQPCVEGEREAYSLPVGVAKLESDEEHGLYSAGDRIRVRVEGIDEKRGQLALTLI